MPEAALRAALVEDVVGEPVLMDRKYCASHNSIHHLYHLARFADSTGQDLARLDRVVEWGGGYGNMAKLFRRLGARDLTYVIVDTPLLSCLQWLYLGTIEGECYVRLLDGVHPIEAGRTNLSTWALSDRSPSAQDYVIDRRWFGAERLLLAYRNGAEEFPASDRMETLAVQAGARARSAGFLSGNRHASAEMGAPHLLNPGLG